MGLVNRALPRAELDGATARTVNQLVRGGPAALAACKRLIARVPALAAEGDGEGAWRWTAELSASLFKGDEAREGIQAFRERRAAAWVPQASE